MNPYLDDPDFTLYCGDALEVLRTLPDESVHCCLTSPPFFGLRDYGVDGQIGLEPTPDEWVAKLVQVFREVRRVLRRDGTLWVEVGDSYSSQGSGIQGENGQRADRRHTKKTLGRRPPGIKPKDLLGTPFLLAFALRSDGWYWRDLIIWHRPNPMPESVRDRMTKAHSYVLMFSRSPRYFYDQEAIAEPAEWARWGDQTVPKYEGTETATGWMQPKTKAELAVKAAGTPRNDGDRWNEHNGRGFPPTGASKNARSVWTIPTQGFPEAHFATWPTALVDRIIRAGTSERGVCPECEAPWQRKVEVVQDGKPSPNSKKAHGGIGNNLGGARQQAWRNENGWHPSCTHQHLPVPATVIDPFMGSGTTALVARQLGRKTMGIELNESYCEMAARRLQQLSLLAETYEPSSPLPRSRGLTGGVYHPPGQTPHSNARD